MLSASGAGCQAPAARHAVTADPHAGAVGAWTRRCPVDNSCLPTGGAVSVLPRSVLAGPSPPRTCPLSREHPTWRRRSCSTHRPRPRAPVRVGVPWCVRSRCRVPEMRPQPVDNRVDSPDPPARTPATDPFDTPSDAVEQRGGEGSEGSASFRTGPHGAHRGHGAPRAAPRAAPRCGLARPGRGLGRRPARSRRRAVAAAAGLGQPDPPARPGRGHRSARSARTSWPRRCSRRGCGRSWSGR